MNQVKRRKGPMVKSCCEVVCYQRGHFFKKRLPTRVENELAGIQCSHLSHCAAYVYVCSNW